MDIKQLEQNVLVTSADCYQKYFIKEIPMLKWMDWFSKHLQDLPTGLSKYREFTKWVFYAPFIEDICVGVKKKSSCFLSCQYLQVKQLYQFSVTDIWLSRFICHRFIFSHRFEFQVFSYLYIGSVWHTSKQ